MYMTPQWFAVRVRSHCEKVVAVAVRNKGFEDFLPLQRLRLRRSKWVEVPLFPGYLFCRLNATDRLSLLTIPGVMHIVGIGRVPEPVDEREISTIQHAVRSEAQVELWPFLETGQRVRLKSGPLAGLEGILVETDEQRRLVFGLAVMKLSIAVKIEPDWFEPASHLTASAGSSPKI